MPGPRVLHIVPALFGERDGIVGGAERFALELARHMAPVTATRLLTFGRRERTETLDDLTVRVAGRTWSVRGQRGNPLAPAIVPEVLRADIVHCHQQHILASSLAALTARLTGRRVFVSELGGGGIDVSTYVSTDRWYHGHLHLSAYSRRVHGHDHSPSAHVICGGVDIRKFRPDPSVQREPRVVFVGRILPHKGVHDLVRALPDGVALDVIGPPHDARYLDDLRRLALGKAVRFRHDCADQDLIEAYRQALCVALPSVYRDPYGNTTRVPELLGQTLLEGMACGAPGIATEVASLPEIISDGTDGFLVPPGSAERLTDRIRWLRDHPTEAAAMGEAARLKIERRFTWDGVVRRCLTIYAGGNATG